MSDEDSLDYEQQRKKSGTTKQKPKKQSQTLNAQFKQLSLGDHPYRDEPRRQLAESDEEEDDIERAGNHEQFTLGDDPNYQGSDFENEEQEPHQARKNPHHLMTESHNQLQLHQALNADINDAASSHYVDDNSEHEDGEDAVSFGDDVSSEGSCIASNSYKRSHIDRTNDFGQGSGSNQKRGGDYGEDDDFNMMDEYDRDREEEEEQQLLQAMRQRAGEQEENVEVPEEEQQLQETPRKGLPLEEIRNSKAANQLGVSNRRFVVALSSQEEDSQQQSSLQVQSINTSNIPPLQNQSKNTVTIRNEKTQLKNNGAHSNNHLQPVAANLNDYKKQFVKK